MNLLLDNLNLQMKTIDENTPYKDGGDFFHALVYSDFNGFFKPLSFQDYSFWIMIGILIFSFVFLLVIKTKSETFITLINQKYTFRNSKSDFQNR